jgi:hypothetical protein
LRLVEFAMAPSVQTLYINGIVVNRSGALIAKS